jgi:bifunctional DNase/RNase
MGWVDLDFSEAYNFSGRGNYGGGRMLEMSIDSIRVSPMNYQRVVILKEKDSDRYLPIWIGPAEADAIAVKLQDLSVPRPLTHDLLRTVIDTLGGKVQHILVSDLHNDTFFAKIVIQVNGDTKEIDSRPSDAMALAVRTQVPIFAEEAVMDKAGILLDKETGKPLAPERPGGEGPAQVDEEELRRMSAFTDFINDLDLEDFGKQQSGGA